MNEETQILRLEEDFPREIEVIEGTEFGPIDLDFYIDGSRGEPIRFTAQLQDGTPLPKGVTCATDGTLGGEPELGTAREAPYKVEVTARSESTSPLKVEIILRILTVAQAKRKEKEAAEFEKNLEALGSYWRKFAKELPLPNLKEILNRAVTPQEIDHLLKQFATLTIWNSDNPTPAENGKLMTLPEVSARYRVYDFGSALVATPEDLFDPNRTLSDAIQTTKAMVHEVVENRGWNISLEGFDVMTKTAWAEVEAINRLQEKAVQVSGYQPTADDYEALERQIKIEGP